jgi:hypothetical protein
MSEKETYELKGFIWLNVFGWIRWTEEEFPHRSGFSLGDETGEKCLEADMLDPLSTEGAMAVLEKFIERADHLEFARFPNGDYRVFDWNNTARAETLELAIALFAKRIFSK